MVHEVLFSCEALLTNVTSVWSFARMFSYVVDHVLFTSESLRAEFASVYDKLGLICRLLHYSYKEVKFGCRVIETAYWIHKINLVMGS